MYRLLPLFFMALLLTGCHWIHKTDIEQGNIYTPDRVKQLRPGMSRAQVIQIMGTPQLLNTFSHHRVDYVYTFKHGSGPMTEKRLTLLFDSRGALKDIQETN